MPRNPVNDSGRMYGIRSERGARAGEPPYSPAMSRTTARALVRAHVALEGFSLSPDGSSVAYVLRRVRGNEYESHLWTRRVAGGAARQLTRGRVRDTHPAISPDGRQLAFIRTIVGPADAVAQAWILPLDGGEPWRLTDLKHGVAGVAWSPDGRRVALLAQAGDARFIVGDERPGTTPIARRLTRLDFRDDESGHVGRRVHLWVVEAREGAAPRQLTRGDYDVAHPAWSPDGTRIAFAADRGPDTTIAPRLQLFTVGVSSRAPQVRELASLAGDADWPTWSPDGRHVAFVGTDVDDPPDELPPRLWLTEVRGGSPRPLAADFDRPIGDWAWGDLLLAEGAPMAWLDDERIAAIVGDRGRGLPFTVPLDGEASPMVDPGTPLASSAVAVSAGRVVVAAAAAGEAGALWRVEGSRLRPLGRDGAGWTSRFGRPEVTELELDGAAGPIQAWLVSPADAGRKRLPTVLHIHGGPTGSWGPGGTMDDLLLTAAGYRVLRPNIRGSATFGADWIAALSGAWGDVDAADALAAVDGVVARGLADPNRLAVMGLSYGGFLTQWLIGVTDRFRAAIAENGVTNQVSTWANSYFGVHYNRRAGLGDPLSDEGMQALWRSSPLRNASRVTTPLLMLQAEEDRICPAADNEQLFTALKVLGRDVEYVLYPEEHHEMKTYGRPDRRIDRLERTLAWLDAHLGARRR